MSLQATDDLVWSCINRGFCSFKAKTTTQLFCRNPHNVTGLCDHRSCPLANSQYATIEEIDGRICLMMKTAERAQYPSRLWEKIPLPSDKKQAKHIIKDNLQFWPAHQQKNVMRRYIRILQIQGKQRKMRLKERPAEVVIKRKVERKMKKAEFKAEKAAHIEDNIKKTLLDRLKNKQYEGVFNFPQQAFNEALAESGAVSDDSEAEVSVPQYEYEYEMEREGPMMQTMMPSGSTQRKTFVEESESGDDEDEGSDGFDDFDSDDFGSSNESDDSEEKYQESDSESSEEAPIVKQKRIHSAAPKKKDHKKHRPDDDDSLDFTPSEAEKFTPSGDIEDLIPQRKKLPKKKHFTKK
ncbi:putative Protein MAK16 like protein [Blattamonas nauphoetae]|uniref:Ribosomal eL28/Mak16 domain-containing protein n=1 Tax=Blattamonas nauphoetae TaxID=2049346 RepID=A0ABQ9XQ15_9EUKA|nr:putative Protein MAK16 like protein [Blattamonas nauphoetae]